MKKIISLILAVILVCSLCTVATAAQPVRLRLGAAGATQQDLHTGAGLKDQPVNSDAPVAQYVNVPGIVTRFSARCPSYGNSEGSITIKLYKWKGDYASTVSSQALASQTYVDYADNATLIFDVNTDEATGELLFLFLNAGEKVGVWTCESKEFPLYVNGAKTEKNIAVQGAIYTYKKDEPLDTSVSVNAYDVINTTNFVDCIVNDTKTLDDVNGEKIDTVRSSDNVGYSSYIIDFGDVSPKGLEMQAYNQLQEFGTIQFVLDDRESGKIFARIDMETNDKISSWETVYAKITEEITGVHRVYIMTKGSRMSLGNLKFLKETPPDTFVENRLKEFNETREYTIKDNYSDTWVATDLLGRKVAGYSEAGDPNPDKQVGMFFWTWHSGRERQTWKYGVNQMVLNRYEGDEKDIKNDYNYPGWALEAFWNESIYGMYSGYDEWVIRKQLEVLSAADIDSLFFDSTNHTRLYPGSFMKIGKIMHQMHLEGTETPKMAFMLPFFSMNYNQIDLETIYEKYYSTGLYSDTWYYWDGKPVIMAYPESIAATTGLEDVDELRKEILDFFTFRPGQADYWAGPSRDDHWPWLEVYPQKAYGKSEKYGCEAVCVGVAQNANDMGLTAMNGEGVYGRSYTYKNRFSLYSDTSKYYGYNFQEQWDRAFELDPEFVFVTGWNELSAGHSKSWGAVSGSYPDCYNDEYSRDLEPTKGEFKDTYYYQLVDNVRKFKGVRQTPVAGPEKTISLNGDFSQWNDITPEFVGYKGGTEPRDSFLIGGMEPVTNYTGRNDIISSKVSRDSENVYFYVETAEDLSPYTDPSWMRLFINTDRVYKTGWEGYDFVLNRVNPTADTAILEKHTGEDLYTWKWIEVAKVSYKEEGNKMMIAIPKSVLGLGDSMDIEFKWNDNMQEQGDITDVYNNGDTAPIGRFNYHYITSRDAEKAVKDETIDITRRLEYATKKIVVMGINSSVAYTYGNKTKMDPLSDVTAPIIINGKTMVPVRFISESMGFPVKWNESAKSVTITGNSNRIKLTLGSDIMNIERKEVKIQSPAIEIESRIYVPLRDIVEAFGMKCTWIDPGIIIVGSEGEFGQLYVNGGMEKIKDMYNFN